MEQYRSKIKKRIVFDALLALIVVAISVSSMLGIIPSAPGEHFGAFMKGFQAGLSATIIVYFIAGTIQKAAMLKNEDKLRAQYIKDNDERTKYIAEKTGGSVMHTCAVLIIVAAVVAGYYSSTVFFTLLGCAVFLLAVIVFLSAYYGHKY